MAIRQDASTGQLVDDGQQAKPAAGRPVIRVQVYSPFTVYFNDAAYSVSACNVTGPFDILPEHHNFISLLTPCELTVDAPSGTKRIRISGGLMHVRQDVIKIFLDV